MRRRYWLLLGVVMLVVGAVGLSVAPVVEADCLDYPDTWCDFQCGYYGGWYCSEASTRCCWESGTGNTCAESWWCEECDCFENPGGF